MWLRLLRERLGAWLCSGVCHHLPADRAPGWLRVAVGFCFFPSASHLPCPGAEPAVPHLVSEAQLEGREKRALQSPVSARAGGPGRVPTQALSSPRGHSQPDGSSGRGAQALRPVLAGAETEDSSQLRVHGQGAGEVSRSPRSCPCQLPLGTSSSGPEDGLTLPPTMWEAPHGHRTQQRVRSPQVCSSLRLTCLAVPDCLVQQL